MRKCSKCGLSKDQSEFYKGRGNCKDCQKLSAAKSVERNRLRVNARVAKRQRETQEFIDSFKVEPCEDCGVSYPSCVMHFHHLDPTEKSFELGRGKFYARTRILEEIAKCALLCANCHALRHLAERSPVPTLE